MEASVNPKKYPHLFGMSIALIDSQSFQSQILPNVSFRCSISNKFPRLLAKREITANAKICLGTKPYLFSVSCLNLMQFLLASHTRNCMIIIAICGSFAELSAKVLIFIENLLDCSVK